jgi:hypothetical protein
MFGFHGDPALVDACAVLRTGQDLDEYIQQKLRLADEQQQKKKKKKHKVLLLTSPFARCVQTSLLLHFALSRQGQAAEPQRDCKPGVQQQCATGKYMIELLTWDLLRRPKPFFANAVEPGQGHSLAGGGSIGSNSSSAGASDADDECDDEDDDGGHVVSELQTGSSHSPAADSGAENVRLSGQSPRLGNRPARVHKRRKQRAALLQQAIYEQGGQRARVAALAKHTSWLIETALAELRAESGRTGEPLPAFLPESAQAFDDHVAQLWPSASSAKGDFSITIPPLTALDEHGLPVKRWPPLEAAQSPSQSEGMVSLDAGEGLLLSSSANGRGTEGAAAAGMQERHFDLIVMVGHKGSMRNIISRFTNESGPDLALDADAGSLGHIHSASAFLVDADVLAGKWLSRGEQYL